MLDLIDFTVGLRHKLASSMAHTAHTRQARNAGIRSGISGGEGSRTLCLRLPKLFIKCNCLGEFDIIGPQKPARLLRKRHAMAHTGHTPTAFQSRERRRCQSPLGDSNGRAAIRAPRLRRLMDFHLLRHSYGTYRAAIPSGCSWRGLPQPSQAGDHEFSRTSRRSRNC